MEPPALFTETVTLRRRLWGRTLASFGPFALMLGLLVNALITEPFSLGAEGVSFMVVLLFSLIIPLLLQLVGFGTRREMRNITASGDGLTLLGGPVIPRTQFRDGMITVAGPGPATVKLIGHNGGPTLEMDLPSRERALGLLCALQLDVLHRRYDVRGVCNYKMMNIPTRFVVGADGLLVTFLGFFAYKDIERIERDGAVVVVKIRDGRELRLLSAFNTQTLHERLVEGLEAFQRGEQAGELTALVDRQARSVPEWLSALTGLLKSGDYRSASVTPAALWKITEDVNAPASARAGAAVALRVSLDDAGKNRLRVVAEASAEPKLRDVLEAAAGADEESLHSALEACATIK